MDLRALRYFVTAIEQGSISAAALRCHIAQPSITLAINKLEDGLRCQLLYRHAKGVTPTPQGEELYAMAKSLLEQADRIHAHFTDHTPPIRFRVYLHASVGLHYIHTLLADLQSKTSTAQIELVDEAEHCDILITTATAANTKHAFYPLAEEQYSLLCPPHHHLAQANQFSLQQLDGEALIERRHCENRHVFERAVTALGIEVHTVAMVDNEEWARSLVAAGLGVALAPTGSDHADPRISAIPLKFQDSSVPSRTVGIALHSKTSEAHQTIINALYGNPS